MADKRKEQDDGGNRREKDKNGGKKKRRASDSDEEERTTGLNSIFKKVLKQYKFQNSKEAVSDVVLQVLRAMERGAPDFEKNLLSKPSVTMSEFTNFLEAQGLQQVRCPPIRPSSPPLQDVAQNGSEQVETTKSAAQSPTSPAQDDGAENETAGEKESNEPAAQSPKTPAQDDGAENETAEEKVDSNLDSDNDSTTSQATRQEEEPDKEELEYSSKASSNSTSCVSDTPQTQGSGRNNSPMPGTSSGKPPLRYVPAPTMYEDSDEEIEAPSSTAAAAVENETKSDAEDSSGPDTERVSSAEEDEAFATFRRPRAYKRIIRNSSSPAPNRESAASKQQPDKGRKQNKSMNEPNQHVASKDLKLLEKVYMRRGKLMKIATNQGVKTAPTQTPANPPKKRKGPKEILISSPSKQPTKERAITRETSRPQPIAVHPRVGKPYYKCPGCGLVSNKKSNLTRHIKLTCIHFISKKKSYRCTKCSAKFSRPDTLQEHFKNRHSKWDQDIRICPICDLQVVGRQNYNQHKTKCHVPPSSESSSESCSESE